MQSLFPDDVTKPIKPPRVKAGPKGGRHRYRRRAWEDHVRPQVYATDLCEPAAADAEVPVEAIRNPEADLSPIVAAIREARVAEYARRYDLRLSLYHPLDYQAPPDYPAHITAIGRAVREEALAEQGLRFLAHGIYPVRDPKLDPSTPWRCQPWIPAQPAYKGRPAKIGRHVNIKGRGKGKAESTHIVSEEEAWLALARYYEEVEGIEVDIEPEPGSVMLELLKLVKEAVAAHANANEATNEAGGRLPEEPARAGRGSGQRKKAKPRPASA